MHFLLDKHTVRERNISGLMNEYKGRDIMKNSVKRTTAAILATMMIGTGMYAPIADHYNLFSQTSITAEAASVGKVTGLKSNTLSNSEIKLKWSKVKGASGYTVYMRKNGKYNKVADTKSTTYTVKKLPNACLLYTSPSPRD
mgnify:CR=1 FL=1